MASTPNVNLLRPRPLAAPDWVSTVHRASVAMIGTSLALLLYPFIGQVQYTVAMRLTNDPVRVVTAAAHVPKPIPAPAKANIATAKPSAPPAQPAVTVAPKPQPAAPAKTNMLFIPKIGVQMAIVEGNNDRVALSKGAWRLPGTSTPDQGGNTVLGGHRWMFTSGPRTFYHLDKLVIGDMVQTDWKGKTYTYRVREVRVVKPEQTEILNASSQKILTLFTCTPIFSSKQRLVVVAEQV